MELPASKIILTGSLTGSKSRTLHKEELNMSEAEKNVRRRVQDNSRLAQSQSKKRTKYSPSSHDAALPRKTTPPPLKTTPPKAAAAQPKVKVILPTPRVLQIFNDRVSFRGGRVSNPYWTFGAPVIFTVVKFGFSSTLNSLN